MPMTKKELFKENREPASLYDVCEWFIQTYPEDVFVSSDNPVHQIRDLSKKVISMRDKKRGKNG